ncbi:MAG TPA: carbohydrate ABC transporter permease [Firmicutes bacterium]|nr:carbohydrate ABC transporter permease [Bacillota bacterium]
MRAQGREQAVQSGIVYILLAIGATVMVGPFVWMLLCSFKTGYEIVRIPPTFWPASPTIENYKAVLFTVPFVRYFLNSLLVAGVITVSVLFTSSLAGYVFAKYRFPGREFLFVLVLSTLMVPFELVMIPLYLLMLRLRFLNTYWALILPGCVRVLGVFLMRQFMAQVPSELMEAARIDGCSEFRTFWSIMLPQVKPALATLGIFTFMTSWNDYLWPLIAIDSMELRTLPVGLAMLTTKQFITRYDLSMAGATLAVVPAVVVFIALQKYFVRGVTMTGLKG